MSYGYDTIQKDLGRMEDEAERNLTKFNKGDWRKNNLRHQYMLEADQQEIRSAEKDLQVLVENKLITRQQCKLAAEINKYK